MREVPRGSHCAASLLNKSGVDKSLVGEKEGEKCPKVGGITGGRWTREGGGGGG